MAKSSESSFKLSPSRLNWLRQKVAKGKFASLSEAANHYLGEAARIEAAREELAELLREGLKGPFERADEQWWARLQADRLAQRKTARRRKSA